MAGRNLSNLIEVFAEDRKIYFLSLMLQLCQQAIHLNAASGQAHLIRNNRPRIGNELPDVAVSLLVIHDSR